MIFQDYRKFSKVAFYNISFPNNQITPNWYTNKIPITHLLINDYKITEIQPNAFSCKSFRSLNNLTLTNFPVTVLRNGIFNDLSSLMTISLIGLKVKVFENSLFVVFRRLLQISIINSMEPETTVNQLFSGSGTELPRLNTIYYEGNDLADVINKQTFGNLMGLNDLLLPNNKITAISEDAFEVVGISLMFLALPKNLLKTLPAAIFDPLLEYGGIKPRVSLQGNLLHCTCDWLQMFVKNWDKIKFGFFTCETPKYFQNMTFVEANSYCLNGKATTTTKTTTLTMSTTTTPFIDTVTTSVVRTNTDAGIFTKPSIFSSTVSQDDGYTETDFFRYNRILNVVTNQIGGVNVHLRSFSPNYVVVWYENAARTRHSLNCQAFSAPNTAKPNVIAVNVKLQASKTYIFCVARKGTLTILPLNCISYQQNVVSQIVHHDGFPWILLLIYAICVFGGVLFLIHLLKKYKLTAGKFW